MIKSADNQIATSLPNRFTSDSSKLILSVRVENDQSFCIDQQHCAALLMNPIVWSMGLKDCLAKTERRSITYNPIFQLLIEACFPHMCRIDWMVRLIIPIDGKTKRWLSEAYMATKWEADRTGFGWGICMWTIEENRPILIGWFTMTQSWQAAMALEGYTRWISLVPHSIWLLPEKPLHPVHCHPPTIPRSPVPHQLSRLRSLCYKSQFIMNGRVGAATRKWGRSS